MNAQNKPLVKPPRLVPGDTIGIVAPAGPFEQAPFDRGVEVLKSLGYRVFLPSSLTDRDRFLAGSDVHRANLINQLFADPDIKGIFCARGGYGSLRILDLLSYDTIRDNPKIFIGFSDITALISAMVDRCDLVIFHGPVLTTLGQKNPESVAGMSAALTSTALIEIEARKGEVIRSGTCTGMVAGGNLNTLCHLVGTPYAPDFKDKIVIFEDTGEAPYRIDRMLYHMWMAGCFEGIAGLALGAFDNCGEPRDVLDVVVNIFEDMAIPILSGFDIGHGPVNLTIPMGIEATLDTNHCRLSYHESAVI